jgi:flagellar biosynthetic protein FliP
VNVGALTGLLGACAITGGLLVLALKLLQRLGKGGASRGKLPMHVLDRFALGPKQGLAVVRVGRRVLLVGTSDHGPRLITEIRGEDRLAVLADLPEPVERKRPDHDLRRLLSRLTLGIVLAAAATGRIDAQVKPSAAKPDTGRRVAISPPASVAPKAPPAAAPGASTAKVAPPTAPNVDVRIGQGADQLKLSGSVGLVVFLGALTLLPAVVLLMTSFTRILIVLHFLRSALGTQSSPPGQLLVAIAVLLTGVVMNPVIQEVNQVALQPYFNGQIGQTDAYDKALKPFRRFMLANVREKDLAAFTEMSGVADASSMDDVPTLTIVSAFVTSELQAAFWMGFVIFLPFVVVDLIVATSLMSLGMFMVPPVMISLPFKLLLFVLADGWSLVGQNLVASFRR